MKRWIFLSTVLVALTACASAKPTPTLTPIPPAATATLESAPPPQEDTTALLERLGGYPCPESEFTCVEVTVPLDHFDAQESRTTQVVFGVLPASGERKGMFVTVIGGPGGSGLLRADSYTSTFDPSIPEHFDVVFFDQRGVNLSGGLQCTAAAAAFYRADWDASTPASEENLLDAAQTFAEACVAEMGHPDILPYMDTKQAVEDLEAFRQLMGEEKFWLYGESYGTQFAQTYAAAHPERLAGLILDGTVDVTLPDTDFLVGQAQAFDQVLTATLQACNADERCAADIGGDAVAAYDALASRLKEAPLSFDFPLIAGGVSRRTFTFADLETAASSFLYSETERMIFLRALAAYARDENLIPLARILYNALALDPETEAAIPDPSYSDAVYYAVTCRDYALPGETPEERALGFMRAGDSIDSLPHMASVFYGDLPCAFWPYPQTDPSRPAALQAKGIPTLVLNATTDPATPYSNAQAVYSNLADGYLVTETGGPHVIFGWGNMCVDNLVTEFLVNDQLPAERETVCEGEVISLYEPPSPLEAASFENPLQAFASLDKELYYLPEYYYWDYETPTTVACPFGGTLTFEATEEGEAFELRECAFSKGFVMSGAGTYPYEEGVLRLDVRVSGLADGALVYTRDAEWNLHLTGEYDGRTIDLSE